MENTTQKPATAARIYDYYLGGIHNFPADQEAARTLVSQFPFIPMVARANRAFLRRVVGHLVDAGIRQFLDVGSGIPTAGNVHEIAQETAPDTRVVYVDIDPTAVKCAVCKTALKTDGFCPAHRMGYVHGHAFMSPLTYYIARGRPIDPAAITCSVCRQNSRGIGWCEKDHLGIAGYIAFDDRQVFDEFSKNYRILLAAVETSKKCETCAAAMMADGYCGIHRVKYVDGKAASGTPP